MKGLLLGTGAADIGSPQVCGCQNCKAVKQRGGRSLRTYSSMLLEEGLLVDCGSTAPARMKALAPSAQATCVLITHPDHDHVDATALAQLPRDPTRFDLPVYGSLALVTKLRYEAQCHLDLHIMRPFESVAICGYEVMSLPARHRGGSGDSLIFVLSREGRRLLYACDSGVLTEETSEAIGKMKLDAVVAEATFGLKTESIPDLGTAHLNFPLLCDVRQDMIRRGVIQESTRFIATHISLHHCPPYEESAQWLGERGITLGFDGLQFEW